MAKTNGTNSEVASDPCAAVPKPKVFMSTNTTFDNIRTYCDWKLKLLEEELIDELNIRRNCCKRKRPRCRLCYEKRSYMKYDSLRRKFVALTRIKEIREKLILPIKGAVV